MSELNLVALFGKAHAAGNAAAAALIPVPMIVAEHASPLDDASPVVQSWQVEGGVCGFAWVTISPGTSKAARFAKEHYGARKGYYGGMELRVSQFGQSMQKKEAYAGAFAAVLSAAGITAYSGSRMD